MWRIILLLLVVVLALLAIRLACTEGEGSDGGAPSGAAAALPAALGGSECARELPYWRRSLPPPEEMFEGLRTPPPTADEPPEGYTAVVQRRFPEDYVRTDGISNHFTEEVRMRCQQGGGPSPVKAWRQMGRRKKKALATRSLAEQRKALYQAARQCSLFNPAFGRHLLQALSRKSGTPLHKMRLLDPSAGWGDRAIAACAAKVARYHGYDPQAADPAMRRAYEAIFEHFRPANAPPEDFWVRATPFEQATVAPAAPSYDAVLTSPPFFTLERYPGSGARHLEKQTKRPDYASWLRDFYRPYLANAWDALRPGGALALYVADFGGTPFARDTRRIIEELGGVECERHGYRQTAAGPHRPAFLWEKPADAI
jgi:hypothetical protein